jgi:hypothetical protein
VHIDVLLPSLIAQLTFQIIKDNYAGGLFSFTRHFLKIVRGCNRGQCLYVYSVSTQVLTKLHTYVYFSSLQFYYLGAVTKSL